MAAAIGALLVAIYGFAAARSAKQGQRIAASGITISDVTKGEFEEAVSVRGTVVPKTTIYLDAVVGGTVEEKLVQQGEYVKEGQPLVRLLNAALYLDVISREAQISEQMNFLRNTQMQAETNRLELRRSLLETDNRIGHLERNIERAKPLVDQKFVSEAHLQELQQDLNHSRQAREVSLERLQRENEIRTIQLEQLEDSAAMLKSNLEFGRSNLENLLIKAPQAGFLSELNVELGEMKDPGARIGQIDIPGAFKVTAALDEYYLNQIALGGPGRIRLGGKEFEVKITKIDSRVKDSQIIVEADLPEDIGKLGEGVKRGQSLQLELIIGNSAPNAILIRNGAFSRETGGNWVFVVDKSGSRATRRAIKLGRRNQSHVQVIEGLEPGERVIVSSYGAFDRAEVLSID